MVKILTDRTTIIIVRHGECKGNREGLFRGRSDFPLNKTGIKQAHSLAKEMISFKPQKIFTSPLARAKQTAEAIRLQCNVEIEERTDLNNIELGPWEGKSKDYIAQEYPHDWQIWLTEPETLNLPGMESLIQVQKRAREGLDKIANDYFGKTVILVSHRAVIKPLIASCIGMNSPYFWHIHLDTASYSIVHYHKKIGFILVQLNQNKHLTEYISEWQ